MAGLLSGVAAGLQQGLSSSGSGTGMDAYQAASLEQKQPLVEAQTAQAQTGTQVNQAKLTGQNIKNANAKDDRDFNQQAMLAASKGGLQAAIDLANKTGHFEWAAARQKEQIDLNTSLAGQDKLTADASDAQVKAFSDKQKALGGLGALFFKDVQSGQDPETLYQKYLPTFKQVWKDAPDHYDEKTGNMLQIAVGQSMQENTNYSRATTVDKTLHAYRAALAAGDIQAAAIFKAQLEKSSMYTNPMTGEQINLLGPSVLDEHKGSVDSKMNAVGLAANSSIIPPVGAIVVKQPLNNHMDQMYSDYDMKNGITPQQRTIKDMKAVQGYDQVIMPDGEHRMQKIAGGPADKPTTTSSEAMRVAAIQVGQKAWNDYADMIIDPKTKTLKPGVANILTGELAQASYIGTGNVITNQLINGFVSPEAHQLQVRQKNMIEGILRGQSGATINKDERPVFEQELLPQPGDDEKTIKIKLTMTHEILTGALKIMKVGKDGKPLTDANGYGQVDWNAIQKTREYAQNGGDVFDRTRGDGMNPEKARVNLNKQTSVDPKLVAMYQDPKMNGQGRVLSEDEARDVVIQLQQAQQKKQGQ